MHWVVNRDIFEASSVLGRVTVLALSLYVAVDPAKHDSLMTSDDR